MVHTMIQGTFRQTNLPDESRTNLSKREELRLAEIELMRQRERVAELRRRLPPGPRRSRTMPSWKVLRAWTQAIHQSEPFDLSELFHRAQSAAGGSILDVWKRQTRPCPMCTAWIDGLNGVAHHVAQNVDLAIVAAADPPALERSRVLEAGTGCDSSVLVTARSSTTSASGRREGNQDSTISVHP